MSTLVALPDPPRQVANDDVAGAPDGVVWLKRLIWTYFWLLMFEGALRKWVFPGLANPLLVVRDPVVILIYLVALGSGLFPRNTIVIVTIALGVASTVASLIAQAQGGHGTLFITLYGIRTNFLHLPLIFLLPKVFTVSDFAKLGKWLLILAFPMAMLVAVQFRSSPDARVNVGAGGSVGGQIEVGFGKIRPAGTFSYNTGLLAYVVLTVAYVLGTQIRKGVPHAKLALAALPAIAIVIAISGSRSTLLSVLVIGAGVVLICLRQPAFFGKAAKGFFVIGIAYFCLTFWTDFRNGLVVHETRFVTGGGLEHGIVLRLLGDLAAPFGAVADTPLLGRGLGMGTNAASGLLTGERAFLLAEGDWERVVRESGPILGFAFIGLRLAILIHLGRVSLDALNRKNPLPALVYCAALPQVLNGQLGVPTTLGFAVFTAGLVLAAAVDDVVAASDASPSRQVQPPARNVKTIRGRSEYAEMLHGS
jgi:hypothetical protein